MFSLFLRVLFMFTSSFLVFLVFAICSLYQSPSVMLPSVALWGCPTFHFDGGVIGSCVALIFTSIDFHLYRNVW